MQEIPKNTFEFDDSARHDLFKQVAGVFAAEGVDLDASLEALMKPLLDGKLSYEEHRAMLEAMLKGAGE